MNYKTKLHFLVCDRHTDDDRNVVLLAKFVSEVLTAEWQQRLLKTITLISFSPPVQSAGLPPASAPQVASSLAAALAPLAGTVAPPPTDGNTIIDAKQFGTPVFLQQPILFEDNVFNFLFDTGCTKANLSQ